jgi:hypothetical protein
MAGLALDADLSAHESHQLTADSEPKPGAAEAPGGGAVGLAERLEQRPLRLGREADAGVRHLEADLDMGRVLARLLRPEHHLAALGELDGVAGEVEEHLPQPPRIATHRRRHSRPDQGRPLQPLGAGSLAQEAGYVVQRVPQVEIDSLQLQPSRFHLGEVEDVVQDLQQGLGRPASRLRPIALLRIELGVEQ